LLRPSLPARRVAALLAIAGCIATLDAPRRPAIPPAAEAGPYPSDWFGAQRAFPGETVNQEAWLAAMEWARVERAAQQLTTSSATPMVWADVGPFNIGGRVSALAVAPGGSTVFLGSAAGGVWKSVDGGVNWDPSFQHVPSIGALALEPGNPNVVYVGTGEANAAIDNYDGAGLFRSSDGGAGWSYLGLEEVRRIGRVAVDPSNPNRIFVAGMGSQYSTGPNRGLYRSENGGQSWSKVLFVNDSTGVCDVVINPAHPETVYCASWERIRRPTYRRVYGPGCGIWRSTDSGTTWTRLQTGLPAPSDDVGRIGLAIAASWPSTVYAQIIGGPPGLNGLGVYRTQDGGQTWVRRDMSGFTGGFGGFGWYFGDIEVDPTNADRVFCLGVQLMLSTDGGVNFANATGNAHVDHHALWIDPSNPLRIHLGNDGGFFWSTTGGNPWGKSFDLPITQFYAGTIDPSNAARIVGGTQDNSTPITTGSPTAWTQFYSSGDGFYCIIDPTNPNIGFAETQNGSGGAGPRRTINGGMNWTTNNPGFSDSRWNWNAPFVMDPNNHDVLLAGGYRVYKSINNGQAYSLTSGDLTRNLPGLPYASALSTLEISPANSNVYYAGTTDGRVWRNLNAGAMNSWTEITAGLPIRWVTRVTADPFDANVVYVTLSGYSQDEYAAHVYRSPNQGGTWTAIDGNLPDVPANDILVDPLNASRLYLATDTGVYTTQNLGATWYPLGVGHPIVPVFDLTLHASSRTLVSHTHGRSALKFDLNDLPVAVGPEAKPTRLALSAPAPNPGHGEARFTVEISDRGRVRVSVFDALGRRIADVLDRELSAGRHPLAWNGRDARGGRVAAGVYYLRAELEGRAVAARRMVRVG